MRRLGVLGGTFDPIHFGHLDAADAARSALTLDEVLFLPAHDSPLRPAQPYASAFHRFAMVALAIDRAPAYRLSDLELVRQGRSYTVNTLRAIHGAGWQPSQIFFILGADAFAEIAAWHAYPAVLDAAHFAVIARPGMRIETALARNPDVQARIRPAAASAETGDGTGIFLVQAHTRDVSSTSVRGRLSARESVSDLVPSSVTRYIAAHHLYQREDDLHGDDKDKQGR